MVWLSSFSVGGCETRTRIVGNSCLLGQYTFFNRALITTLTALSRDGPWMLLKMNKLRDTKFCEVGRIFEEVTHGLEICDHSQCNCYCEFFQQGVNEYGLEDGAPLDG